MGLLDKLKSSASKVKDKADDLAEEHGDKVKQGLGKAGDFVDKKTGRKHSKKIDGAVDKAEGVIDDLAKPDADEAPDDTATPEAGEKP